MAKKSELDRVKELMDKRSKENPVEEIKEETEAEQLKKRLAELESKEKDKDEPVYEKTLLELAKEKNKCAKLIRVYLDISPRMLTYSCVACYNTIIGAIFIMGCERLL